MEKNKIKRSLSLAGNQNQYQKMLIILLTSAWISMVFVYFSSPFVYINPQFHCQNDTEFAFKQDDACKIIEKCHPIDHFTLTAELELYCEKSWARIIIQSIFPLGSFVGVMIMNYISDTKGRKKAILITLGVAIFAILLTLIGGSTENIFYLVVAQFLGGFGSYPIMPLAYTMAADFFGDNLRPKAVGIFNSSGGLAMIGLGFLYLIKINWFYFIICFQLIPFIALFIIFYYKVEQSPYILMSRKQIQQAKQICIRIAKFNNNFDQVEQIERIFQQPHQQNLQDKKPSLSTVYKTISQWKFLKTILILIFINGISNINYYGITYSFAQEGLGYGFNSMVMGLIQASSVVFLTYTSTHIPRKLGIAGFFGLTMLVGFLYMSSFVENSLFLSTLFIGISRMCAVNAYCLVACMITQAFTTSVQSTAAGLIQGFSIIGAALAPSVIQLSSYLQINPVTTCAIFVSCAIWPAYFLKQTFKKNNMRQSSFRQSVKQPLKRFTRKQIFQMEMISTADSLKQRYQVKSRTQVQ